MKRTIYLLIAALSAVFPAAAQNSLSLSTVVIDPGHGGHDPGAVSQDGKTYEKTLTLDIAKRLGEKIRSGCPGVKVILTRETDKYVELGTRADIANKAGADLFISIHINSIAKSGPNGYSVYVLGKSQNKNKDLFAYNMNVCKRENSVILLEDDYTTKYQGFDPSDPESFIFLQLTQNSHLEQSLNFAQTVAGKLRGGPIQADRGVWQDSFLVLWRTAMPAVLVELGFISNATDLKALRSQENRDKIAAGLYNAFVAYKAGYDKSVSIDTAASDNSSTGSASAGNSSSGSSPVGNSTGSSAGNSAAGNSSGSNVSTGSASAGNSSGSNASSAASSEVLYGVQIFAGPTKLSPKDKAFMGYEPLIVDAGRIYKYIIGVSDSEEGARAELGKIREKYKDAFLVKVEGKNVKLLK
ncbi:MAG: N-acetylmuramoyl-L-alanine amidase [Bacteroidales bacterium]|nr:N-acetylmuramoyl-L-alanine amidase [Bacteroidales bacterium]